MTSLTNLYNIVSERTDILNYRINNLNIPSPGSNYCIYQQGGSTNTLPIFNNWASVATYITDNNGAVTVYIDNHHDQCTVSSTVNCFNKTMFIASTSAYTTLIIEDGYQLQNPLSFTSIGLSGAPTSVPSLALTTNASFLYLLNGTIIQFLSGATTNFLQLPTLQSNYIYFVASQLNNINATSEALINVGINATLNLILTQGSDFSIASSNIISSTNSTGTLLAQLDPSSLPISYSSSKFTGTISVTSISAANLVNYVDDLSPTFGASNVQTAIDYVKQNYLSSSTQFIDSTSSSSNLYLGTRTNLTDAVVLGNSNASFQINTGVRHHVSIIIASIPIGVDETMIFVDSAVEAITLTLPPASLNEGRMLIIKDLGNAGTNTITIMPTSPNTIDGNTYVNLSTNYAAITLISSGQNWYRSISVV